MNALRLLSLLAICLLQPAAVAADDTSKPAVITKHKIRCAIFKHLDGTQHEVNASAAISVPKQGKGIWATDGYTKFWFIDAQDRQGL